MMMQSFFHRSLWRRLPAAALLLLLCCGTALAQQPVLVSLAPLDGTELTPDNILGFQLQSFAGKAQEAEIRGRVTFRATGLSFGYTFRYTLQPGMNLPATAGVQPQWTFSSSALRELFLDYKKLPTGTYEYCVEATPMGPGGELIKAQAGEECLYFKSDDLFLINLVDPENKAKLHESYPMLSWMVNYPFASALTYRVRVAEVKDGQNATAAINRNNLIYQESDIARTAIVYPVYAKPLEKYQPYAWTVDAYYKGILLGGAEPWQFMIVDDSIMANIPKELSHLDIRKETGGSQAFAIGKLKIKYTLQDLKKDSLTLRLLHDGKEMKLTTHSLTASQGDNRYELDFYHNGGLQHLKLYTLEIINLRKEVFKILFRYVNPDFVN